MKVVRYQPTMKKALQEICIVTASKRARQEEKHRAFTLAMYCNPYLEHGDVFVLVNKDDVPVGYILCCVDFSIAKPLFQPYYDTIVTLGEEYQHRLEGEMRVFKTYQIQFPSHMHIDILPAYTGHGYGHLLFEALVAHLKAVHSKGLLLGVSKENTHAVSFYKACGMRVIEEDKHGCLFGMTF